MPITYRKATQDDLQQLVDLRIRLLLEAEPHEEHKIDKHFHHHMHTFFKTQLDNTIFVYIAEENNKIIATSGAMMQQYFPRITECVNKAAHITNVYTLPQYRKQGISSKLVQLTLDELKAQNTQFIWLWGTNEAHSLYEKAGFSDYNAYNTMTYTPK